MLLYFLSIEVCVIIFPNSALYNKPLPSLTPPLSLDSCVSIASLIASSRVSISVTPRSKLLTVYWKRSSFRPNLPQSGDGHQLGFASPCIHLYLPKSFQ